MPSNKSPLNPLNLDKFQGQMQLLIIQTALSAIFFNPFNQDFFAVSSFLRFLAPFDNNFKLFQKMFNI